MTGINEGAVLPEARRSGLVVTRLGEETLVYDLERHRALCLNRLAAAVWHRCDGQTSIPELASHVSADVGAKVEPEMIWYALRRLSRKRLLTEALPAGKARSTLSRRDALRRLAAAGAISVGLPIVLSVVAPTALQAQGSCAGAGQSCAVLPCCQGLFCVVADNTCEEP